nr:unnamed protein product [Digitaria exilis]
MGAWACGKWLEGAAARAISGRGGAIVNFTISAQCRNKKMMVRKFSIDTVYNPEDPKPIVALFVGCLTKSFVRTTMLSGNSACKWYFNPEIPKAITFHERLAPSRARIATPVISSSPPPLASYPAAAAASSAPPSTLTKLPLPPVLVRTLLPFRFPISHRGQLASESNRGDEPWEHYRLRRCSHRWRGSRSGTPGTRITDMMTLQVAGGMGCVLPHLQAWRQALRSPRIAATTAMVTAKK